MAPASGHQLFLESDPGASRSWRASGQSAVGGQARAGGARPRGHLSGTPLSLSPFLRGTRLQVHPRAALGPPAPAPPLGGRHPPAGRGSGCRLAPRGRPSHGFRPGPQVSGCPTGGPREPAPRPRGAAAPSPAPGTRTLTFSAAWWGRDLGSREPSEPERPRAAGDPGARETSGRGSPRSSGNLGARESSGRGSSRGAGAQLSLRVPRLRGSERSASRGAESLPWPRPASPLIPPLPRRAHEGQGAGLAGRKLGHRPLEVALPAGTPRGDRGAEGVRGSRVRRGAGARSRAGGRPRAPREACQAGGAVGGHVLSPVSHRPSAPPKLPGRRAPCPRSRRFGARGWAGPSARRPAPCPPSHPRESGPPSLRGSESLRPFQNE